MKRLAYPFTSPTAHAVAAAVVLATIALTSPSPAHAASVAPGQVTAVKASAVNRAEARIKELHTQLKITQTQEDLWHNVTQVMRDNAKTMDALTKARSDKTQTMSALDDLKSYGDVAEAHAAGIKKFTPVFGTLYASMSDAQKKNADTIFRNRSHTRSKRN
jgi:hypothetical protein